MTSDWRRVDLRPIEGVAVHEVRPVPTHYGVLTEVLRTDWKLEPPGVDQVFQAVIEPGHVNAWHAHAVTTDRLFVSTGVLEIVLYDARAGSPTCGELNHFRFGAVRPALVVVPPRVWHGVRNPGAEPALLLNIVDRAYSYDDPDHLRLPPDTDQIPHRFD